LVWKMNMFFCSAGGRADARKEGSIAT